MPKIHKTAKRQNIFGAFRLAAPLGLWMQRLYERSGMATLWSRTWNGEHLGGTSQLPVSLGLSSRNFWRFRCLPTAASPREGSVWKSWNYQDLDFLSELQCKILSTSQNDLAKIAEANTWELLIMKYLNLLFDKGSCETSGIITFDN